MTGQMSPLMDVLEHQGRSVTWFCERLGIDRSLLYRWNDGSRTPSEAHRRVASQVLGVPEALLFLPTVLRESSDSLSSDSEAMREKEVAV